jgi:hypothetical protein
MKMAQSLVVFAGGIIFSNSIVISQELPSYSNAEKAFYCLQYFKGRINHSKTFDHDLLAMLEASNLDAPSKAQAKQDLEVGDQRDQVRLTMMEAFALRVEGDSAAISARATKRLTSDVAACQSARESLLKDTSVFQCIINQHPTEDPLFLCAKQRSDEAAIALVAYCGFTSDCEGFADSLAMPLKPAATVTKGQACEELALKETYPVAMRDKCKGNLTEECKRLTEGWVTAAALKKRQCITEPRGDLK